KLAMLSQTRVAQAGEMGVDRFVGQRLLLPRLGKPGLSREQATRNLYAASGRKEFTRNLLTEGIMGVTLRENSMLDDDDIAHNVLWGALGLGAGQLVDSMVTTYALRKMANSRSVATANRQAYDVSGLETGRIAAISLAVGADVKPEH